MCVWIQVEKPFSLDALQNSLEVDSKKKSIRKQYFLIHNRKMGGKKKFVTNYVALGRWSIFRMPLLFDAQFRQDNGKSKPLFCQHGNRLVIYNALPAAAAALSYTIYIIFCALVPWHVRFQKFTHFSAEL